MDIVNDDETRPVRAVRRASSREAPTQLRPAVRRRSIEQAHWLPPELQQLSNIDCVEERRLRREFLTHHNTYFFAGRRLIARPRWRLFRSFWKFDFILPTGETLFSATRGLRWLVLETMTVRDAHGAVLGRFVQRATAMNVHFDVFDAHGEKRMELRQPSDTFTTFWLYASGQEVGRIERRFRTWDGSLKQLLRFEDAFELVALNPALDELDRVLAIAAGLLVDRVFFSGKDD